jgi:hypothetical protein
MTEEIQKDPMDDVVLNFSFTVAQINGILHLLGNAPLPYIAVAPIVNMINEQGQPQFRAALEAAEKEKNESQTTS